MSANWLIGHATGDSCAAARCWDRHDVYLPLCQRPRRTCSRRSAVPRVRREQKDINWHFEALGVSLLVVIQTDIFCEQEGDYQNLPAHDARAWTSGVIEDTTPELQECRRVGTIKATQVQVVHGKVTSFEGQATARRRVPTALFITSGCSLRNQAAIAASHARDAKVELVMAHLQHRQDFEHHAAVSLLASHQDDPSLIPGRVTPDCRVWESCWAMPLLSLYPEQPLVARTKAGGSELRKWGMESLLIACLGTPLTLTSGLRLQRGRGETGDPRENPPTSGIVWHDSHVLESGSEPARNRARFAVYVILSVSYGGRIGVVARLRASHLGEPGSIPGGVTPGYPHVVGFLSDLSFPCHCILELLNTHLAPSSSALKTSICRNAVFGERLAVCPCPLFLGAAPGWRLICNPQRRVYSKQWVAVLGDDTELRGRWLCGAISAHLTELRALLANNRRATCKLIPRPHAGLQQAMAVEGGRQGQRGSRVIAAAVNADVFKDRSRPTDVFDVGAGDLPQHNPT
ncbi:hypothetical protein PR048_017935 [Dryococelus australis]|uniref:Uncharacterized protein n=1 Tax=Dryococelus australis TaxID=614101 RepID=A0ABQ9HB05_9NEOP|nr:hypothetical protein PR048_017935 [Dryococelus australis]